MSVELKIKAKHLALEPGIIRKEERKLKTQGKWLRDHQENDYETMRKLESLANHRKWDVRNESRATHLARAFIAGKNYSEVEKVCNDVWVREWYITPRVLAMVTKYGNKPVERNDISEWYKT